MLGLGEPLEADLRSRSGRGCPGRWRRCRSSRPRARRPGAGSPSAPSRRPDGDRPASSFGPRPRRGRWAPPWRRAGAVDADHPVGDRPPERVGHRGAEDRQRPRFASTTFRSIGSTRGSPCGRVQDVSGLIDLPSLGACCTTRLAGDGWNRLSSNGPSLTGPVVGLAFRLARCPKLRCPTCMVARAHGDLAGHCRLLARQGGLRGRRRCTARPETEPAPMTGWPKGYRVPMHLAPRP